MGASQEKKRRREEREVGTEKRFVQNKKQEEERRKRKRKIYITSAILAVFIIVVVFFSIPQFYSGLEAVEIDGESFSVAEYNYYYYTLYYAYYEQAYSTYGSYYNYAMPDEDTIRSEVLSTMRTTVKLAHEADEKDFEVTDEIQAGYDELVENTKVQATTSGFDSFKKYLKSYYGNCMTEKTFLEQSWYFYYASEYSNSVYDSYIFTEDELKDYYAENKDSLDVFNYRYFLIDGSAVEDNEETEEDESVDAETAMANAKATAEEFVSSVKTEQDFIDMAYKNANDSSKETYENPNATLHHTSKEEMSSYYSEWVLSDERKEGDVEMIEASSAYYVMYYIGREENKYPTADIQMIYVGIDYVNKNDYEEDADYEAAVGEEIKEAENEAKDILDKFNSGNKTSEEFASLSDEYDERSSRETGGIVENTYKYRFFDDMNNWLFEEQRESGDTSIFYKEDDGYYIVLFGSYGEQYCDYLADSKLRTEKHSEWQKEIEKEAVSELKFWYRFTV